MRAAAPDLHAVAALAVVGTGDREYAADFKAAQGLDAPVLVDDDQRSYEAVGADTGGVGAFVSPRVVAIGARAVLRGARQGRPGRAPRLLGATHVLLPDGSVPFAWRNGDVADSAPPAAVLDVLRNPA